MISYTPISLYRYDPAGYTNITPFTIRNAATFAAILDELRNYVGEFLVPETDSKLRKIYEEITEQLNETISNVNKALDATTDAVNVEVGEVRSDVEADLAANKTSFDATITQLKIDFQAIVDDINDNGVELQDGVMAGIIDLVSSASRLKLDALYQPKGTVSDSAVANLLDSETETREGLDARYFRAGGTTLDVVSGGTGRDTGGTAFGLLAAGVTSSDPHQTIEPGATRNVLFGGGPNALPEWGSLTMDSSDVNPDKPWSAKKTRDELNKLSPSMAGTLAARPAASTVPSGTLYAATDTLEVYRSTSTSWLYIAGSGNFLAEAIITGDVSPGGSGRRDIAGLSTTFVAGTRPVLVGFELDAKTNAGGSAVVCYLVVDGVTVNTGGLSFPTANSPFNLSKSRRMTFTPGTTHTVKVQVDGGGTITIAAAESYPARVWAEAK